MNHIGTVEKFFHRWATGFEEFCASFPEAVTADAP